MRFKLKVKAFKFEGKAGLDEISELEKEAAKTAMSLMSLLRRISMFGSIK